MPLHPSAMHNYRNAQLLGCKVHAVSRNEKSSQSEPPPLRGGQGELLVSTKPRWVGDMGAGARTCPAYMRSTDSMPRAFEKGVDEPVEGFSSAADCEVLLSVSVSAAETVSVTADSITIRAAKMVSMFLENLLAVIGIISFCLSDYMITSETKTDFKTR